MKLVSSAKLMTSIKNWRDRLDEFPIEHRMLIEGGNLSTRFSKLPLAASHPVFIGAFYGFLLRVYSAVFTSIVTVIISTMLLTIMRLFFY